MARYSFGFKGTQDFECIFFNLVGFTDMDGLSGMENLAREEFLFSRDTASLSPWADSLFVPPDILPELIHR